MDINTPKLGVIGGLGPKASSYFYDLVIDNILAKSDQDHIDAIYLNHASMPDRTESILAGDVDNLRELLIKDALLLERLGCSHIAIPCNTSHYFWDDISKCVHIPVINMIKEVINYIRILNGGKVDKIGVLATNGTVKTGIYDKEASSNAIEVVYPNKNNQDKVMEVIYNGVKSGKPVKITDLDEVIEELKSKGCDAVVLGCTELSVLFKGDHDPYIVDALFPLAIRAIELSGKSVRA
jgi:aspartate racemase